MEKDKKVEEVFAYTFECRDGYMILYALAATDGIPIERIRIDYWGDIHDGETSEVYSRVLFLREYPEFQDFAGSAYARDRGPWIITLKDGSTISGGEGPVVRIRTGPDRDTVTELLALIKDRDRALLRSTGDSWIKP